jgi:predicted transcriptional regulator
MNTTTGLLDWIKERHRLPSDYALSKLLGVKTQTVSSYRTGRTFFDVEMAFRVAELLELDPAQVIAWIETERAERAARAADAARWIERAKRLAGVAAVFLAAVGLTGSPSPAQAASGAAAEPLYIMSSRRKGKRRAFAAAATRAAAPLLSMLTMRWSSRA